MDPDPRNVERVSPRTISPKNSGGPKSKARRERDGAIREIIATPKRPAMNEPKAEIPRARPALPWRAI
jgi:hypothetical protein